MAQRSNIPLRYRSVTVDGFKAHTPEQEVARAKVVEYLEGLGKGHSGGITLHGTVGCGKTHLAAAILRHAQTKGYSIHFATEDGIFDTFKQLWEDPTGSSNYLAKLQKVRFLVIDDMGIRKPTEYVSDRYEAIINTRYSNMRPTIITTNRRPQLLEELYERQLSRLKENTVLHMVGPDMRGTQ
jgi:DNA replication protein DnaC